MEGALENCIGEAAGGPALLPNDDTGEADFLAFPGTTDCGRTGDAWDKVLLPKEPCLPRGAARPLPPPYPPPPKEEGPGDAARRLLPPIGRYCERRQLAPPSTSKAPRTPAGPTDAAPLLGGMGGRRKTPADARSRESILCDVKSVLLGSAGWRGGEAGVRAGGAEVPGWKGQDQSLSAGRPGRREASEGEEVGPKSSSFEGRRSPRRARFSPMLSNLLLSSKVPSAVIFNV